VSIELHQDQLNIINELIVEIGIGITPGPVPIGIIPIRPQPGGGPPSG
jgi:hypothetical protein